MVYKWLFPKGPSAAELLARRSGGYIQMSDRFAILETCRQVHGEVASLLRGQQRFVVKQPKTLFEVMDVIDEIGDYAIEREIFRHIAPELQIDFLHDLDHSTVSSGGAYLLHINRGFRERVAFNVIIQVTAALSITGGFQKLRQWTQNGSNHISSFGNEDFWHDAQVELRVPRTNCDENGNFVMDAAELILATIDLCFSTQLRAVVSDEEEETQGDHHEFHNFRAGLLLFMHTLIKKSPKSRCPKMRMRGDLRVAFADLEHDDGHVERVFNRNGACSWHRTFDYLLAADLVRYYRNAEGLQAYANPDESIGTNTLLGVAKTLARTLYTDIYG